MRTFLFFLRKLLHNWVILEIVKNSSGNLSWPEAICLFVPAVDQGLMLCDSGEEFIVEVYQG